MTDPQPPTGPFFGSLWGEPPRESARHVLNTMPSFKILPYTQREYGTELGQKTLSMWSELCRGMILSKHAGEIHKFRATHFPTMRHHEF